ncbi:kinesin-like protein KIF23 [Limulus polyphemus]|uniref:Kinesin-like protein KIF23 n=1 Tax=Limulus polyphemus TaxID=6850 RepID=A0ABM1SXP6_LIMPO|nr:kinesin-like protein KIF23 [Limulus polyphemus]
MKPVRGKTPKKPPPKPPKNTVKDPVEVYCRLRPLENQNDFVCVTPLSNTVVQLVPPGGSLAHKNNSKEIQYTYRFVFDENTSQKSLFDNVALPLVSDLVSGKNGLLFTYGITSSGKTYTMTGTPQDGGILPRCLDVIFNSIRDLQAQRCVFKSDKMNGFDVQTKAEAMVEQSQLMTMTPKTPRAKRRDAEFEWVQRIPDETVINVVDQDNVFSVFVSYIEIYNNYIYDLLEDVPIDPIRPKPPQSRILREDSNHDMYVFGVTELEVKSSDEAFEAFCKGQRRRRVAHTALNTESSRSHSVFNIRLVQAPLDSQGAEVLQDKDQLRINQLSLVDLAGSERTGRTRNTGDRLREAGNINTSLMALRACIDVLRENQTQGTNKMVPYRETKLTNLFKRFFEGEGKVRMIVCVNPHADDYDETLHVMRFAEMTQEVMVSRATPVPSTPVSLGLRPGRGTLYREALRKTKEEGGNLQELLAPGVYSLGPPFPDIMNYDDEESFESIIQVLIDRKSRRETLLSDLANKQNAFRNQIIETEKENVGMKQEIEILKMELEARVQQVRSLEGKLSSAEHTTEILRQKVGYYERSKQTLEYKLDEKKMLLSQGEQEKQKIREQMEDRLVTERGRMRRIMERRLAEKQAELEAKMCLTGEKIQQLREILNSQEDWEFLLGEGLGPRLVSSRSEPRLSHGAAATSGSQNTPVSTPQLDTRLNMEQTSAPLKSVAVANPRHRRSRSSGGEKWIDHRPPGSLEYGTVLQPNMKKKKSVSKLETKDITGRNAAQGYVLTHQEQDIDGDVETKLYKGNVVPSSGGGAQVIFDDVEILKQTSPTHPYQLRKRSFEGFTTEDVQKNCAVSVEGHKKPPTGLISAKRIKY